MQFRRTLKSGIVITSTRAEFAQQLHALQDIVFPTLDPAERFRAEHYHKHLALFPDGQFVALDGDRVVGMTSTIRISDAVAHHDHTFAEVIEGGWLTSHDPTGTWLYGADVGTHPDYRGRGIARGLYAARQATVQRLGLRGQVTVGMLRGISALAVPMELGAYYEAVEKGRIQDPTVSMQMHVGFVPAGLIRNYINDPVCAYAGARLVLDASRAVHADWADAVANHE